MQWRQWVGRFLPSGIRERLFLLIAVAAAPMLILQVWLYYQRHDARRTQAIQTESDIAQGVAMTFSAYLDGLHRQLNGIGETILAFSPYDEANVERVLTTAAVEHPSIRTMNWVSPEGKILASNMPEGIGKDVSTRPYFEQIQAGKSWAVGDLTQRGAIFDSPTVAMGAALRDADGKLLGVVVASLEPTRLGELTFPHQRHAGGIYTVFDRQGQLVYRNPSGPLTWEDRLRWQKSDSLLRQALQDHPSEGLFVS
ncbi:MAG: cache domain-containing protein, partial [Solirubrobacterales bacterium]